MQLQANPDYESLKMLVIIAGALILILLSVIGFLAGFGMKKMNKTVETIQDTVSAIIETVSTLKTVIEVIKTEQGGRDKVCSYKHIVIDKRLKTHSEKIEVIDESVEKIDKRLIGVEEKLKIN